MNSNMAAKTERFTLFGLNYFHEIEDEFCMTHGYAVSPNVKCPKDDGTLERWNREYLTSVKRSDALQVLESIYWK